MLKQINTNFPVVETPELGGGLRKKALDEMRRPAIGCFVAGTLVHTKEGLKPIEQIKVGDWVLSRPENPEKGTEPDYKRVTRTFRFVVKEVVEFTWVHHLGNGEGEWGNVYVTPNHLVWSYPHGWVAMGRMFDLNRQIPGTIPRGPDLEAWLGRDLVHFDGSPGERYDVSGLYKTDRPEIAFGEEDDWGLGTLIDFANGKISYGEDVPYDYEKWGDPINETRELFSATVYSIEVEDWHTYFVGKTGLWVRNTN